MKFQKPPQAEVKHLASDIESFINFNFNIDLATSH